MKITSLSVKNFLGVAAFQLINPKPVIVISGGNAAGKTSIYQAIKLALLGDVPRIDLMRDAQSLVRSGGKSGSVTLEYQVTDNMRTWASTVAVSIPDRKQDGLRPPMDLRFSIDPHAFSALEPKERMRLALNLSGVQMDKAAIVARLEAHSVPQAAIDEVAPLLTLGFEKCCDHARGKAAEYRGGWRAITGETYGSKKAENWTAPATVNVPEAPVGLDEARQQVEDLTGQLATLKERTRAGEVARFQRGLDTALVNRIPEIEATIARTKPLAESGVEPTTMPCPACGAPLLVEQGEPLAVYAHVPDRPTVKPSVKAKAVRELATAEKELKQAQVAAARMADPLPDLPEAAEYDAVGLKLAETKDLLRTLESAVQAHIHMKEKQAQVQDLAVAAAQQHMMVQAFEAAEAALSPTGIPSELMAQAMSPLRSALRHVCASEYITDWPLPEVADDGTITAWGRPYSLLSESEQYRADLLLAAALAVASGSRILVADRADVLEPNARGELVNWLLDLTDDADTPTLDCAWIFLTLKAPPAAMQGVESCYLGVSNG